MSPLANEELKSKNEKLKKSAAGEKESAEKWGIPGSNQVEGKHQSQNVDGASDTNYASWNFGTLLQ